jgi:hypothetical protein
MLLCETDYCRRLDLLCNSCGGPLRGSYITAENRKFHLDHFRCEDSGCHVVFRQQDPYYEHQDKHYCLYHYCQYHYCQTGAPKCASCGCPILQKFVELQRRGVAQRWHPECYMIHKHWAVHLKTFARARLEFTGAGWRDGLGNLIGHAELERALNSVVQDIERIWTVLSGLEEAVAAQISDIFLALSSSQDLTAFIRTVRAMLRCTAALLDAVQHVAEPSKLGFSETIPDTDGAPGDYRSKSRLLCLKIVSINSLAVDTFSEKAHTSTSPAQSDSTGLRRTQAEALTSAIAHYVKQLVRVGLRAITKSESWVDSIVDMGLFRRFLLRVEDRSSPTALVQALEAQLDAPPSSTSSYPDKTDICMGCGRAVEDCCYSSQTEGGIRYWHVRCVQCEACGRNGAYEKDLDGLKRRGSGQWTMRCTFCRAEPAPGKYGWCSTLDFSTVLLYVAFARFITIMDTDRTTPGS